MGFRADDLVRRVGSKIQIDDGCWEWTGAHNQAGYGLLIGRERRVQRAHRVVYEWLKAPIPEGLTLDHLCRNRGCVRPSHLEPVTRGENVLRGIGFAAKNRAKTHCVNGHEFDEANTYWRKDRPGSRQCKKCSW